MSIVTGFTLNPQLHRYGKLCKRDHDHEGTGKSLRYKSTGGCIYCDQLHWKEWDAKNRPPKLNRKEILRTRVDSISFDEILHKVSNLMCVNGHDYEGSNQTLRYRSTNACVYCMAERRDRLREKTNANNRERWQAKTAEEKREYSARQKMQQGAEKRKEYNQKYNQSEKGKAKNKANRARFKATEKGKLHAYLKSKNRRIRLKGVVSEKYTGKQIQERRKAFDNCCAYCGTKDTGEKRFMQMDHVICIKKNGADRIANLVPACINCNSSKNDSSVEEWYPKKDFATLERLEKVLSILGDEEMAQIDFSLLQAKFNVDYIKFLHSNVLT